MQNVSSEDLTSAALASSTDKKLLDYVFFQANAVIGHEQAQAIARIVIGILCLLLITGIKLVFAHETTVEWSLITLIFFYWVLSLFYYQIVSFYKEQFLWRRYVAIAADLTLIAYGQYLLGNTGFALYPLYLWVIIGNGLRFGTRYLLIATIVGFIGYISACWASSILYTQTTISLSLLTGMVLIPKFFMVMVCRLSEINHALQEKSQENEYAATHDTLTGLPNRTLFYERLNQIISKASREKTNAAVIFIDLDAFKAINDNFGHNKGDSLLVSIAECLTKNMRSSDLVARVGGDEFVVLLEECGDIQQVTAVVEKISKCSGKYFELDHYQTFITWSCGVAIYPQDGTDSNTLIKNADTAMYQAKSAGPNQFMFYSSEMTQEVKRQLVLRDELRYSIDNNDFVVYYQPLVDAKTGSIIGAEALVRWLHPERGLLTPFEFIDLAEQTGLIIPIGDQVLKLAIENVALLRNEGFPDLSIHVNISPRQLVEDDFIGKLHKILNDTGLSPSALHLEVTESIFIEDSSKAELLFLELQKIGVSISLDDFGTGYSSLAYLKKFPIDIIKIDRSFVRDIPNDADDCNLVEAMLDIGDRLDREIIAEGVEDGVQMQWLLDRGCRMMQGYHFSKPVAQDIFRSLLEAEKPLRSGTG